MLTQKQENFCTAIVLDCMTQHDAYIKAYNTNRMLPASIDRMAFDLVENLKIASRIKELRAEVKSDLVASEIERKEILTEIARARLTDYITCGPDRDLVIVGPESPNTVALQEITSRTEYDEDGAGEAVITKLKLHNPIQAIAELNKMDGAYAPEKHASIIAILSGELTDDELVAIATKGDIPSRGGNGASEKKKGS